MRTRPCKGCRRPIHRDGPAYCSDTCWDTQAARRRVEAAGRSRSRRTATSRAANTTIDTEGAYVVTRVWVNGLLHSEDRQPVA